MKSEEFKNKLKVSKWMILLVWLIALIFVSTFNLGETRFHFMMIIAILILMYHLYVMMIYNTHQINKNLKKIINKDIIILRIKDKIINKINNEDEIIIGGNKNGSRELNEKNNNKTN